MFYLDTNIVIGVINGRNPAIRVKLRAHMRDGAGISLPAAALFELRYGIAKSDRREASERQLIEFLSAGVPIVPFDAEDAEHAGDIRAMLEKAGAPIGHYDLLIAAQARSRKATLVTANGREFERVPGLRVTDWAAP